MSRLNRRDFLKALGFTGSASVLSACGLDDNRYLTPIENVLPYVVRPEQVTPGTPTFFATTVTTGLHAYSLLARHRDGRVVNVNANEVRPSPDEKAAVPSWAFLELQRHYSPDRFTAPQLRSGGEISEITWDDGMQKLADAVTAARAAGKTVAYLGPYRSGSIVNLLRDYTGDNAVFWEPLGPEAEVEAAELLFGERVLPGYDLSGCDYVLSFGAEFMSTWGRSAELQGQYGRARNPNVDHRIARFALVSPHRDTTGVNSDDWFAVRPGTEALVARAVAKIVAQEKGYQGPALALLQDADPAAAAQAAGIDPAAIQAIAAQFVAGTSVALPGGIHGASANAVELAMATYLLNIVSGNAGRTFGIGDGYDGPIDSYDRVASMIEAMKAGDIAVLLVDDVNPVYALPADSGFTEALANVGMVVGVSSHPDETNANAHLVLPCADAFEDWGDERPSPGLVLLRQPAMTPLYDARSFGDVLLATAKAAGLATTAAAPAPAPEPAEATEAPVEPAEETPEAATPAPAASAGGVALAKVGFDVENWREYVKASLAPVLENKSAGDYATPWEAALADGFVALPAERRAPEIVLGSFAFSEPAPLAGDGEYALVTFPHVFRYDGRYANQPWAQEFPDPTTGHVWDSWVEVHPATAAKLGVENNDLVEISTPAGALQVGVSITPDVHPDAVAMAFGQGHTASGRYAVVGRNVVTLLATAVTAQGTMAWQQVKASVAKAAGNSELFSFYGSETDQHRQFAPVAPAADLAKVGDAPSAHPGELTGIHHLARDPRLEKSGDLDFYPMPDHPVYRWGMTVDINACTGCGACGIACYAENNIPVVGREKVREGRWMGWLRLDRFRGYASTEEGPTETRFLPAMCQQCGHAPCESVCPVLATYHSLEGLNAMVYNRCVGTRYCANACPYKARRFNWHTYAWPEPFNLQLNPDVVARTMGVMEKCTFCVQRIRQVKSAYRDAGFDNFVPDEAVRNLPACAEACPSQAITFGNLENETSVPALTRKSARSYELLAELNVMSAVNYLAKASFHVELGHHGGGDHADSDGQEHSNPSAPGAGH